MQFLKIFDFVKAINQILANANISYSVSPTIQPIVSPDSKYPLIVVDSISRDTSSFIGVTHPQQTLILNISVVDNSTNFEKSDTIWYQISNAIHQKNSIIQDLIPNCKIISIEIGKLTVNQSVSKDSIYIEAGFEIKTKYQVN